MNVRIQSVKFNADVKLLDFIQSKMDKLDRFLERAVSANVTLRLDKDADKGNKIAKVSIMVPGEELIAERKCKSFEEAVDSSIDALKKQIDKHKERYAK